MHVARILLFAALGLIAARTSAQDESVVRLKQGRKATLVRVVDDKNKALPNGTVVFHSRLLARAPQFGAITKTFRSDARGRARCELDWRRVWSAWAVHDRKDGTRLASRVHAVSLGRPLRLQLSSYAVPNVRLAGEIDAWRRFAPKLRVAFVLAEHPSATFVVDIPQPRGERRPALRLPPLPIANYYPCLVDKDGGVLDSRYYSPAFATDDPPEELYERDVPLKRIVFAAPKLFALRVTDSKGTALPGAEVSLRPEYASSQDRLTVERRFRCDAEGRVAVPLANRKAGFRGWQTLRIVVTAPGFAARWLRLDAPPKDWKQTIRLVVGQKLSWKIRGFDPKRGDRLFANVGVGYGQGAWSTHELLPIGVSDDGSIELPGRLKTVPGPKRDERLLLVREGRVVPLAFEFSPPSKTIDLTKLRYVDFVAVTAQGRPVRGGRVIVCRRTHEGLTETAEHAIAADGRCRFATLEAKPQVYVRNELRGDQLVSLESGAAKPHLVRLTPLRVLRVRILDSDGKAIAGATASFSPSGLVVSPPLMARLISNTMTTSPASGEIRWRIPSIFKRGEVSAWKQTGQNWLHSSKRVDLKKSERIDLTISRQ